MSRIITNTTNKETKTHISEHRFGHVVFGTHVKLYLSMEYSYILEKNYGRT